MFAKFVHGLFLRRTPNSGAGSTSSRLSLRAVLCASVVTLPLLLLLAGCNAAGTGVFYSVENEKKVSNASNNLPNDIISVSLVQYNNTSGVNALYEASGTVYGIDYSAAVNTTTGTWNTLAAPTGLSNPWCTQVAATNSNPASASATLYAIYGDSLDGSQGSVYEAQPSAPSGSNGQNVNWSVVSPFNFTGGGSTTAQSLFVAGPSGSQILFVEEMTDTGSAFSYSLWAWTGSGTPTEVISNLGAPVVGVVYDSTSTYYFASGATLYSTTSPSTTNSAVADSNPPSNFPTATVYGGIYWSIGGGGTLFLSTRSLSATTGAGYVYARSGNQSTAGWTVNSSAIAYDLTSFGEITLGGTDVIVVGADQGYYELDLGTGGWNGSIITPTQGGSLTTDLNYVNIPLKTAAVNGFFVPPSPNSNLLFAMSTQGLWVNNEPSGGGGSWEPE